MVNAQMLQDVANLEAEIASLLGAVREARAEQALLVKTVEGLMSDNFIEVWDAMEAEFAPLFGERGVYPEFPQSWFPAVLRMCQRLRAELSPEEYASLRITSIKEKHGCLDIGYYGDADYCGGDGVVASTGYNKAQVIIDRCEHEAMLIKRQLSHIERLERKR